MECEIQETSWIKMLCVEKFLILTCISGERHYRGAARGLKGLQRPCHVPRHPLNPRINSVCDCLSPKVYQKYVI